jgi:hypothetical protein
MTDRICPECGAELQNNTTCQEHFHQMLAWEWEYPGYWDVHHLMVLCYHLQHPSLYSPDGLQYGVKLLETFVKDGVSPQDVRQRNRDVVNSHNRSWKVTGTPDAHGVYDPPIQWNFTAATVIANGAEQYCESVKTWARAMYEAIKNANLLATK